MEPKLIRLTGCFHLPVSFRRIVAFLMICCTVGFAMIPESTHAGTPEADDYTAWLETHFPAAFGVPALEESVWGDHADPDDDGCVNLMEFLMVRNPNSSDPDLAERCKLNNGDLVITYRETTKTNHGVSWLGEWSVDFNVWLAAGVRYQTIQSFADHRIVEARIAMNREKRMLFRLAAER